jgi:long-chain acyl-CoA synthetase
MPARPPVDGDQAILLTGSTGFVGMELLARFLERTDRTVFALVRAADGVDAENRIRKTMTTLFGRPDAYAGRVVAVPGDIERDRLGLDRATDEMLAARVTDVVHGAASVSFDLPLEESRRINVAGTQRLLEFAERCPSLGRFCHVSTAYVAGTHTGSFREDQLDVGQDFRNAYEQSKFEAERLVREHGEHLPNQIFRPSIVVGERESGWTASFNVLYAPLRAFSHGAYPVLPARRAAPVDVVPVDYVADAIVELATRPLSDGENTYHLVAGEQATTVGSLIDMAADFYDRPAPRVMPPSLYRRCVHPLLVRTGSRRRRRAVRRTAVYFPYFEAEVRYDDRRARGRLEPAGIEAPNVEGYFDRLARFAERARWGRESITRPQAAASI